SHSDFQKGPTMEESKQNQNLAVDALSRIFRDDGSRISPVVSVKCVSRPSGLQPEGQSYRLRAFWRSFQGAGLISNSVRLCCMNFSPHSSRAEQRQFCIFKSSFCIVLISRASAFSSSSFFEFIFCQRSEGGVLSRKPKNNLRISSRLNPTC